MSRNLQLSLALCAFSIFPVSAVDTAHDESHFVGKQDFSAVKSAFENKEITQRLVGELAIQVRRYNDNELERGVFEKSPSISDRTKRCQDDSSTNENHRPLAVLRRLRSETQDDLSYVKSEVNRWTSYIPRHSFVRQMFERGFRQALQGQAFIQEKTAGDKEDIQVCYRAKRESMKGVLGRDKLERSTKSAKEKPPYLKYLSRSNAPDVLDTYALITMGNYSLEQLKDAGIPVAAESRNGLKFMDRSDCARAAAWVSTSWNPIKEAVLDDTSITLCNFYEILYRMGHNNIPFSLHLRGGNWIYKFMEAHSVPLASLKGLKLEARGVDWFDLISCQKLCSSITSLELHNTSPEGRESYREAQGYQSQFSNLERVNVVNFLSRKMLMQLESLTLESVWGDALLIDHEQEIFPNLIELTLRAFRGGETGITNTNIEGLQVTCPNLQVLKVFEDDKLTLGFTSGLLETYESLKSIHILGKTTVVVSKRKP
jgi:hypothetical protein